MSEPKRVAKFYTKESETFIKLHPEEWDEVLRSARAKLHPYRAWPMGHDLFEQMMRISAETALVIVNAVLDVRKHGRRE